MGGLMKVPNGRGRKYGLMLILAFGAAILGVMAIHKLREKRYLSLLVQEKDRELFSLQLLLQKGREEKDEAERKTEVVREKVYSLQREKKEFEIKIVELQTTISSLQEEQRTIGLALEEKHNEIKRLQEKLAETDEENARVVALTEILKQREDEIQDLKNRLEKSNQVFATSKTDAWREEHEASRVKQESGNEGTKGAVENLNEIAGEHSQNTANDVQGQKTSNPNETTGKMSENNSDEVQGETVKDLQDGGMQEDKTNADKTMTMANQGDNLRTQDISADSVTTEGKANGIGDVAEVENVISQGDASQQLVKLEVADNSQEGVGNGVGAKHGRYKELRDAELQKLDTRGNNQDADSKVRDESGKEGDGTHQQGESMEVKNEDGGGADNSGNDAEKAVVFADESGKSGNNDIDQQNEKVQGGEYENLEKPNGTAADAEEQKSDEVQQQSGGEESAVHQKTDTRDGDKADQHSEEAEPLEVAQTQNAGTDSRKSRDEAEEDDNDPDDL